MTFLCVLFGYSNIIVNIALPTVSLVLLSKDNINIFDRIKLNFAAITEKMTVDKAISHLIDAVAKNN